jgi:hypothetical protein
MKFLLISAFSFIAIKNFGQNSVYHSKQSKLPDSITVKGNIINISPGYCGVICIGGVLKVRLKNNIKNYPYKFAYLVTACLSTKVKINQQVKLVASKLTKSDKECYYQNIKNTFDSNTIPFYKLSERETAIL